MFDVACRFVCWRIRRLCGARQASLRPDLVYHATERLFFGSAARPGWQTLDGNALDHRDWTPAGFRAVIDVARAALSG
jgi:hypothetical protein